MCGRVRNVSSAIRTEVWHGPFGWKAFSESRVNRREEFCAFLRRFCRWRRKGTKMAAKWSPDRGAIRSEPFPLLRSVVWNGPEPSRGRRCWARRSEPLTARTVLRLSLKRERRGERLAKRGPPFWCPRPPPLTRFTFSPVSRQKLTTFPTMVFVCQKPLPCGRCSSSVDT